MSSDVVLTAALRNNLLSLQGTQSAIDKTQIRLSTGKKVNSALDNPQSFFASKALANRADDLGKLLDSIGQSIQVIKAADTGVTALTNLINQAQAIATTAQDQLSGATTQASATGTADLGAPSASKKLNTISGIGTGDQLIFNITDPTSTTNTLSLTAGTVTIGANDTAADLVTKINDLNTGLTSQVISASLDSSNRLTITAANGGNLSVQFKASANTQAANQANASALGFGNIATFNQQGAVTTTGTVDFTVVAGATISSKGLYTAANTLALASSALNGLKDSTGTVTYTALATTQTTLKLSVGGKTSANLFATNPQTQSIQSLIDNINNDATIKSLVSASFDGTTGKIILTAKDATATDVQTQLANGTGTAIQTFNIFGFAADPEASTTAAASSQATEEFRFGASAGTLASLQTQYNGTLAQIDQLVSNGDTGYRGTNLLNGNSLITTFNESRTSKLTTAGVTFTSSGLGIKAGVFNSSSSISSSLTQITSALTTVRNFGSSIANDLATIQTRQDFTTNLINTLNAGADLLVNADQNEEGAKLLALQTRQQLGVTALSLASQSQQSILRLF